MAPRDAPHDVATAFQRAQMLSRLQSERFDLVVVGGGITGCGVALDAVTRGLRVALVERDDFAAGTSSKSSKLIHGGLRYLQQGEIRLVYEALHERQRLLRNAPHLVRVLPFMIPILVKDGPVSRRIARALGWALWMYDLTGGWRIGKRHRRLSADEAFSHLPTMERSRLTSAYLYFDATADDARLCLTVAQSAADHGAVIVNGCSAVAVLHDGPDHRACGVEVDADGERIQISASVVVNAAGVWSDEVRTLDEASDPDSIRPAKGIHITVPWHKVRNDIAVVIPVPKDKRSLFVVPWGARADGTFEHVYVGTTDTDYQGPLDDPRCTADDLRYLLGALNASVSTGVTADDVSGAWAGLRPLVKAQVGLVGKRTSDLSRRHRVTTSPSGVITVTGGKLTTYRAMAEDTVDVVMGLLKQRGRCTTKRLTLHGAHGFAPAEPGSQEAHLAGRYGVDAPDVLQLVADDPSLGEPLVPGLPYLRAEAVWAARHEMVRTLDDVLSRRTRCRLFDRSRTAAVALDVARLIAPDMQWDDEEVAAQAEAFRAVCDGEDEAVARVKTG